MDEEVKSRRREALRRLQPKRPGMHVLTPSRTGKMTVHGFHIDTTIVVDSSFVYRCAECGATVIVNYVVSVGVVACCGVVDVSGPHSTVDLYAM